MDPLRHGPFHRLESPSQSPEIARLQVQTGEIWGAPSRPNGLYPCVKAYPGVLGNGLRGIEFTTPVEPDLQSSTPNEFRWYYPQTPEVERRVRDGVEYAAIPAEVENRQVSVSVPMIAPLPAADQVDLVPQAVISVRIEELRARFPDLREDGHDDLDAYEGVSLVWDARDTVAIRRYRGHPAGTATIYLDHGLRDVARIRLVVAAVLNELAIPTSAITWQRGDDIVSPRQTSGGMGAPALVGRRPVLVTGGAGFIGSNIADRLAREGHDVLVYDAMARPGVERNLAWLTETHPARISSVVADIRDDEALAAAVSDASAVFHLAAQVAVTTSLADPASDFDVNVRSTFRLLEALRRRDRPAPLVFASTNKVYGDLADVALESTNRAYLPRDPEIRRHGISELRPLDFHTPYGCSKGAADQYVLDYARSFGVPTVVLRMSCIYGQRQMGTEDQGWVAHFAISALEDRPVSIFGDGSQVRDVMDVSDAVDAYLAAWRRIGSVAGRAFNLGGGPANAISLRDLLDHLGEITGRPVRTEYLDWRPGDQRWFVADARAARAALGLAAPVPWRQGVGALARWLQAERGLDALRPAAAPPLAGVA